MSPSPRRLSPFVAPNLDDKRIDCAWADLSHRLRRTPFAWKRTLLAAAAVAAMVVLSVVMRARVAAPLAGWAVESGDQQVVSFPDGTRATLRSGARLRWDRLAVDCVEATVERGASPLTFDTTAREPSWCTPRGSTSSTGGHASSSTCRGPRWRSPSSRGGSKWCAPVRRGSCSARATRGRAACRRSHVSRRESRELRSRRRWRVRRSRRPSRATRRPARPQRLTRGNLPRLRRVLQTSARGRPPSHASRLRTSCRPRTTRGCLGVRGKRPPRSTRCDVVSETIDAPGSPPSSSRGFAWTRSTTRRAPSRR